MDYDDLIELLITIGICFMGFGAFGLIVYALLHSPLAN